MSMSYCSIVVLKVFKTIIIFHYFVDLSVWNLNNRYYKELFWNLGIKCKQNVYGNVMQKKKNCNRKNN